MSVWDNFTAHRDAQYYNGSAVLHLASGDYAERSDATVTDLDYTQDFSIDLAIHLEKHCDSGRSAFIIGKGRYSYTGAGFAIYLPGGHIKTFGKDLSVRIGDGTNTVSVSSDIYTQGICHIVVTWDVSEKILLLYIDGELVDSDTNLLINTATIENSYNLKIGSVGYTTYTKLEQDIFFARIWQRLLSSVEVTSLYTEFQTGRNSTPTGFDRTNLVSEWLMIDLCATDGSAGSTHIKDNVGGNHLELLGGATLLSASGSLAWIYPADTANNVSPAAFLEADGGEDSISDPDTLSIQYYFQIDEVATFDSINLKESGWIPRYAMWRPILKPSTLYYARVKCKDSSDTPDESSYTSTISFTTRAPQNWYVRPGVYTGSLTKSRPTPVGGTYGLQDGTSYENAWNGIREIVWGANGVCAGDTLYICGQHIYTINSNNYVAYQGVEYISECGFSDSYPIIIRMDYHGDPGSIWGYTFDNLVTWSWSGPDANGVYSTISDNIPLAEYRGKPRVYKTKYVTTWVGDYGAKSSISGTVYIKTFDGKSPANQSLMLGNGYRLPIFYSSYIKFYKCRFYNNPFELEKYYTIRTGHLNAHHINFEKCIIWYGTHLINPFKGNNNFIVSECDLGYGTESIYTMTDGDSPNNDIGVNNLTVEFCKIHDIGTLDDDLADSHGIGIQAGSGHLIQYNEIWNTGGAIVFHSYFQYMHHHIVRYNYIHDTRETVTTGGIKISGDNATAVPGLRTDIHIYGNILARIGNGSCISGNCRDPVDIYNNIAYSPGVKGINMGVTSYPVSGVWHNNIVVDIQDPSDYYLYATGTHSSGLIYRDNLVYESDLDIPKFKASVSGWQNDNTVIADPLLKTFPPVNLEDFELQNGSPAWTLGWERIPIERICNKYTYAMKRLSGGNLVIGRTLT